MHRTNPEEVKLRSKNNVVVDQSNGEGHEHRKPVKGHEQSRTEAHLHQENTGFDMATRFLISRGL